MNNTENSMRAIPRTAGEGGSYRRVLGFLCTPRARLSIHKKPPAAWDRSKAAKLLALSQELRPRHGVVVV